MILKYNNFTLKLRQTPIDKIDSQYKPIGLVYGKDSKKNTRITTLVEPI